MKAANTFQVTRLLSLLKRQARRTKLLPRLVTFPIVHPPFMTRARETRNATIPDPHTARSMGIGLRFTS